MDKIKTAFWAAWDKALDIYEFVPAWISRNPHWTFWIVLAYLVVRR